MITFTAAFVLVLAAIPALSQPLDGSSFRARGNALVDYEVLGRSPPLPPMYLHPRKNIVVNMEAERRIAQMKLEASRRIQDVQAQLATNTMGLLRSKAGKSWTSPKNNHGTASALKAYAAQEKEIPKLFGRQIDE